MRSEEKSYFDAIADQFDARYNVYSRRAGLVRVQRRAELFTAFCHLRPGLKTLEIGCGTGEYSKALLGHAAALFATDLSFSMLERAKIKLGGTRDVLFFVSDIERLPVSENSFDVILGNSVLHHLETGKALSEIFRAMKKGGRFAFSEPNMLNPQIFLQKRVKYIKKLAGDSPHETAFFRWDVKAMLEKAGFRNVIVRPFDFLHPYTPAPFINIVDTVGKFLERTPLKEIAGSLFITGEK
jgi:ubiquinone/menaquinone biosynthesis C-methylase UbiE